MPLRLENPPAPCKFRSDPSCREVKRHKCRAFGLGQPSLIRPAHLISGRLANAFVRQYKFGVLSFNVLDRLVLSRSGCVIWNES